VKKGAERMVEHTAERLEKEGFVVYDADQISANMLYGLGDLGVTIMRVAESKEMLRLRGVSIEGKKKELLE
jgi:hypothetical protein